jgi:hypothetical protein
VEKPIREGKFVDIAAAKIDLGLGNNPDGDLLPLALEQGKILTIRQMELESGVGSNWRTCPSGSW